MEKFRNYLEKYKEEPSVVGIFTVNTPDHEAGQGPDMPIEQIRDRKAEQVKQPLQNWVKENGGTLMYELAGAAILIVSGSYEFWQKLLTALESKDPAFAHVESLEDNEPIPVWI